MEKIFIALSIIIVVVIALSIYLGYIMGSIAAQRTASPASPTYTPQSTSPTTKYERIDITSAYVSNATYKVNGSLYYEVKLEIKNKGSINVTIDKILVNNKPILQNGTTAYWVMKKKTLDPNETATIYVYLNHGNYSSGQVVQIIIHTTRGGQFPTQVTLP